eukprot:Phypoly_transcript_20306.p1 GENE.Phypoly_transcript_20306~~Phypoly_transcript_20306.p1  ORF type:complete len:138 (+),score=22.42 Phypoly_transcript_20306:194-607(+)
MAEQQVQVEALSFPRPILADSRKSEATRKLTATQHRDVLDEVVDAIDAHAIVIVGMSQNPFVRKARNLFTEQKLEVKYLEYGSYFSQWDRRLAIKMWSGWPTFPQIFVNGVLIGGHEDAENAFKDGSLRQRLAEGRK